MPSIPPLSSNRAQRIEAKYNVVTDFTNLGLHSASAKRDIGLVQYALTHGQPVNSVLDGIVPLHAACSGGSEIIVNMLLDCGADVNAQRLPRRYSDRNKDGTIIGSSGSTPLHFAAANGHISIVNILLSRGADPLRPDKHGTTPESLARAFGHDHVVTLLRDWIAARNSPDHTLPSSSSQAQHHSGATIAPVPASPTRSRRGVHVKRSLENLLTRKAAQLTPSHPVNSGSAGDPTPGVITPGTPSGYDESQSNVRRPSLPFIFERTPAQHPTKHSASGRPRSAGQDADGNKLAPASSPSDTNIVASAATVSTSSQRRLVSKISLLNIFKKSDHTGHAAPPAHANEATGGAFGASSPNLLAPLQPPADIVLTRPRSSTEDLGVMHDSVVRRSTDRDSLDDPSTAPPQQSSFFPQPQRYSPGRYRSTQRQPPSASLPRGARSNSHSRAQELRRRADSSATLSSSSSSIDSHPISSSPNTATTGSSIAMQKARSKKDRSASEGAGMSKRSPLATEWIRNEDGSITALPGVIADDDGGEEEYDDDEDVNHAVSWSTIRQSEFSKTPPSQTPTRPSLITHSSNVDSSSPGGSSTYVAGHFRTNSNQSIKALRFDPTVDIVPPNAAGMNRHATTPVYSPTSPSRSNTIGAYPTSSSSSALVRKVSSQKALRSSSSVGSLQWSRKNSTGRLRDGDIPPRSGSVEEHTLQIITTEQLKSPDDYHSGDEGEGRDDDDDADRHGEGLDSVGEPLWKDPGRTTFGRTGSNSSGQRPSLASLSSSLAMTPATPRSAGSLISPGPDTAGTASSGGRPWALPSTTNTSQTSLPQSPMSPMLAPNSFSTLSGGSVAPAQPTNGNVDSRMRGASVSSSMSTDTNTNSTSSVMNPTMTSSNPTSEASNSGVKLASKTNSRSPSTSTVGRNVPHRQRSGDLVSPTKSMSSSYHRHNHDLEGDSDSDSSAKEGYLSKHSSTPVSVPVLLRSVNSHAQAHALVEKAEKEILDLADLPPDSAPLNGMSLSAQLAAYGESLAIERRFARGEAQKWVNRSALEDDSDEEYYYDEVDMEKDKYPRGPTEAFIPSQTRRKTSGGAASMMSMGSGGGMSDRGTGAVGRSSSGTKRGVRGRNTTKQPPQINTSISKSTPIRTTPSNVGPPARDLKSPRLGEDHYSLNHLVLGGIEITQTLPTPTDSPLSAVHNSTSPRNRKSSPRDSGPLSGGGREVEMADGSFSSTATGDGGVSPESPHGAPLARSTTPDIFVSDYQPVPLSRVSTLPTSTGPSAYPSEHHTPGHTRTNSAGTTSMTTVLMGPPDYIPPRSESRMKSRLTGLKHLVQTLKGKS